MTKLIRNFYTISLHIQSKTTNSLCRFVAVLLMSISVFSYAQADVRIQGVNYTETNGKITVGGVEYEVWQGDYDAPANGTRTPGQLQLRNYFSGSGTQSDPYIIDSAKKFATLGYLSAFVFTGSNHYGYFKLTKNICLAKYYWTFGQARSQSFQATLDGDGHTIIGLYVGAQSGDSAGGGQYRYGLFSCTKGANASNYAVIKNLTISKPTLMVEGAHSNGEHYFGIIAGRVQEWSRFENIKVVDPIIDLNANHQSNWYVSTGIAYNNSNGMRLNNIVVKNPTVKSSKYNSSGTTYTYRTANTKTRFFFGGAIAYSYVSSSDVTQVPVANNLSVTGANISFLAYKPDVTGNYSLNNFTVGGVVGVHVNPHKYFENLYFSGKVFAPFAIVAPCLASTQDNSSSYDHIINYYSGESESNTDEVERSASSSWHYGSYKIGIYSDLATPTQESGDNYYAPANYASKRYVNYKASDVETIDGYNYVDASKLLRHNRFQGTPRRSSTILWWTERNSDANNQDSKPSVAPTTTSDWCKGEQYMFPEYSKNAAVFPWYYMYYAQGVNRDTKYLSVDGGASSVASKYETAAEKNVDNAMGKSGAKNITLTLTDNDKGKRGFDAHSFSVTATGSNVGDISSYQWYVDGVAQGTGNSINVEPSFNYTQGYQNGTSVIVQALDGSSNILAQAVGYIPVARLRFQGSETTGTITNNVHTYVKDAGTKEHPYLIGSDKDLRLLSEHIKQSGSIRQENVYFTGFNSGNLCYFRSIIGNNANNSQMGYGQANFELDANIEMNKSYDFIPIGANSYPVYHTEGTNGTYNNNFSFVGVLDGKGYKISGLRQTWGAGYANSNTTNVYWGLFSEIGSTSQYNKVGESSATRAAVRNLIIDDAVITHDTSNRSFYYPGTDELATSGNANNCFIGPLAGIAGNYSTIENISVTNSKITDDGSLEYKLAAKRLSIGGVIGRATAGVTNDNATLANATLRYLSSDTDIDIQHAEFSNTGNSTQIQAFNVGGIVGSIHSNDAANTVPFPRPAVYTGRARARNATIGPVFGYVSWNGFTNYNFLQIANHYVGKTSATGNFDATGMFYSNYDIYTESSKRNASGNNYIEGYKRITDSYPSPVTNFGDRNIKEKATHPTNNSYNNIASTANYVSDGDMYEYQGVNEGNYAESSSAEVTDAFNDYSSLLTDEQELIQDYKWNWSSDPGSNIGGIRPVVTIGEVKGLFVVAKDTYNGEEITDHILKATVNTASTAPITYQWYKKERVNGENQIIAIDGATSDTYTATPNIHNQYIFVRASIDDSHDDSDVILIPKTDNITASASKIGSAGNWTLSADLSLTPTTSATTSTLTDAGFGVTYQWYKGSVIEANRVTTGGTGSTLNVTTDDTTLRYCVITVVDNTVHSDYTEANTWRFTVSKLPADVMVIFLDPRYGDDANDGKNPDTAVRSWHKAYSLLVDDVTWDDNKIVLMNNSDYGRTLEGFMISSSLRQGTTGTATAWYNETWNNTDNSYAGDYRSGLPNSNMWKNVTITGYLDSEHDYRSTAQISFGTNSEYGIGLFGDTKFEHLTFEGGNTYNILYCQYHDLEMGEGVVTRGMRNDTDYGKVAGANDLDFQIFGGFLNDLRFRDNLNGFDYAKMQGTMDNGKPWLPHGKEGFKINIKSGHYSVICSSYRQNLDSGQGMIGTPNMPLRCTINVDIDRAWNDEPAHKMCITSSHNINADYDIGLILAGNHEGAMYGNVDINVYSGHIGRIASGTLGALRTNVANWWTGHYQPLNAFMGRARILLDPAQSRFATNNETASEKNNRVIITELYGGGVGRSLSSSGMINIPFYGHTSITMNGGTFSLLPSSNTSTSIFPGIYATGAGGLNGMYPVNETIGDGEYLSNQRLPYWVTDSNGQVDYGSWNTFKAATGDRKVYIKCYDDFNMETTEWNYTSIDPEDAKTTVVINDGVFGSATKPIDGIYGGGSGYTPTVWLKDTDASYPNFRSGNIYGKEGADHPVASLTINGGDFYLKNGVFAGGRGTDYYYNTKRASDNASNYTTLGQIFGDVELNITGGIFHHDTSNSALYKGNVYGAGLGVGTVELARSSAGNGTKGDSGTYTNLVDMARIYGTTTVNISGGTIEGSVYGGGAMGDVGYGTASRESQAYEIGTKNAVTLNITGGTIAGDIYGGSMKSDIYGNAATVVNGAQIGGDIYGGGHGELDGVTVKASADVTGNTSVTLGSMTKYAENDDAQHYIYGGGNLASVIGVYNNSSDIETTDMATVASVKSGGTTTVNINNGMGTSQLTVYGAGLGANTYCNMTNVNINNFATQQNTKVIGLNKVFGGGNEGLVYTKANVFMNGGQVLGEVFGGGNLAEVGTLFSGTEPFEDYGTTVSLANDNAMVYGNIYGGGNKAVVKGLANVNLSFGQFAGEVFGGGKGEMTNANTVAARADIQGQTRVFVNGAKTIWNKLWDESNKEFVNWSGSLSDANIARFIDKSGTYPKFLQNHNIYGGGYLACTVSDTARVEVTNGAVPSALIKLDVWKNSFRDDANPHFYVFGGGYGAFTQVANTDVTVGVEGYYSDEEDESTNEQWSLDVDFDKANNTTDIDHTHDGDMGIYGNGYGIGGYTVLGVIGGGYAGLVKANTNVKLGGTTFVHRVYGGGYGQLEAYNALASGTNITAGIDGFTSKTRNNLGEVGGDTKVLVSLSKPDENGRTGGVYGDVFGGGAGVDPSSDGGDYTDYPDMGKVLHTTRVDIVENARVYGNVYGGGDVANVANTASADSVTVVKVRGGDIFGSVFGGGKGRIAAKANDYTTLGNVAGNTFVIVRDSLASETVNEEVISRTISPNVWADIYGGGEVGDVNGNADVVVEGGNIGGDIYGAGLGDIDKNGNHSSADIVGNTVIRIDGGSFLWDKTAGLDGNVKSLNDIDIERETALAMVEARKRGEDSAELTALNNNYADIFSLNDNLFLKDHNIYGGGNNVSVVGGYRDVNGVTYTTGGSASITVNHGLITDEISYYDDRTWKLSTVLKQLCTGNNSHPQFSVLGGGYGINTTIAGNTLVNVQVGKDTDGNPETIDYPNQTADRATWDALYDGFGTEYSALPDDVKDEYYGGTSGSNGQARYETSRLANLFRIPNHTFMNIVGGGMAGTVGGNATVNITDQSVCQNVFGGGIGLMPTSPTGNETYGQVTGTATVNIFGGIVKGNVYGGGAGMESYDNNGTFIDFPNMGAVNKNTTVTIDGTPTGTIIFGKVFGGGDIANVKNSETVNPATNVLIKGGCVYQEIFAGGSGVLRSEANDYTTLGKVNGNTLVTIQDNETPANSPWLWNRVYGGGSYGSVTGNTNVEIQGGHLGYNIFGAGFGDVRTLTDGTESITSSDVTGDTNVNIRGGEWCLSQMWDIENRNWVPKTTNNISAQFDMKSKKFLINHNIYGGGNAASRVANNANITMTKGLLLGNTALGHDDESRTETSLFESVEWREVYNKIGSFHFSVIGGGYGEKTSVGNDTYVNINIPTASGNPITAEFIEKSPDVLKDEMYTLFKSGQAILDVIGGGYNGKVEGDTHVTIGGDPYIRRTFGGSFYADVNNTYVKVNSACADYFFAGGMMGDVLGNTNLTIGNSGDARNSKILICEDVYGGNDVSGQVNGQINVDILGGKFYHNIYGAGNGNYLYALNEERTKVAAVEDYEVDGAVYPLVYEVPRRHILMPASAESSSEAARLVNINSYRPLSQYINLNVNGYSEDNGVKIVGKLFGGGNTATVTKLDGENEAAVTVNIGNYVNISEVYMGADGEAMFDESTTGFLNAFKRINNIVLSDGINWANDPYNSAIPETYLPLNLDERQKTFPHIIDLYFQPVEMSIQPVLKWNGTEATHNSSPTITGTTIGSFFCGSNRGNMDVTPETNGKVVDYLFPEGLTITDKIVGGCNNANFTRTDLGVVHEGGYLLGKAKTSEPMIRLTVKANMRPTEKEGKYYGANVYGGCYKSGSIHGDVKVDMFSNIINGLDVAKLAASNADKDVTVGSVYGAGYGTDSYVYGDINVTLGSDAVSNSQNSLNLQFQEENAQQSLSLPVENDVTSTTTYEDTGSSVNNLYGGGELGNVIGNTTVRVLNGHVVTDVVGGSYSGTQYGSTQVLVGYPQYYTVNESGVYKLKRADTSADNLAIENYDGSKAIKDEIYLIAGDIVSPVVRDAIAAYDAEHSTSQANNLSVQNPAPSDWDNVSITIGEAVYGGGYALSSGYTGTGGAGTYTVKKYTDTYNADNTMSSSDPLYNNSTKGYGGNTTVLVWDNPEDDSKEHITISSESADGGFYGDGHLSYAEGFRSGELKGYGYAEHTVLDATEYAKEPKVEVDNAKMMNTIQRLDLMRLTDNCLILNGARDYTVNEVSTTPYSIARVGELQMVSSIASNVTTPFPTLIKARNYLGLTNNIHYVGAIKSSVDFDHTFHGYNGAVDGENKTYREKKEKYISDFYGAYPQGKKSAVEIGTLTPEQQSAYNFAWETFNMRNDATSLNMIGLSSGYALKVQNTYTTDEVGTEGLFYGPVDGVIEIKLIQPISEEGGGYVYADNVHGDKTKFLESTGNFVFPTSLLGAQRVVDDCLLTNFDKLDGEYGTTKDAHQSEMHYWFLTGRHYFYNLHITGYTYDSNDFTDNQYVDNDIKGIKFNADTSDGLTILEGASNNLVITGVKWNHHHKEDGTADTEYNDICDIEKRTGYTLRLSASNTERNDKTYTYYNQDEGTSLFFDITPSMEIDNGDKEPELSGGGANPEFTKQTLNMTKDGSVVLNDGLSPSISSPLFALQLVDNVNNGVANDEGLSASEYYNRYLSRPDTLQIELRSKPEQWNTYTINLIINYVKGPSYTGNLVVDNCALPGEYIKIRKDGITIDADETFAQNGEFLRIGKRTYDGETSKWSLDEGYLTYDASGENTSPALKGKVYSDPAGKYLMIPAYYFMNGYGVQYVFTCNNMGEIPFPVDMREADKLIVHNYHQMKPRATFDMDLHLAEAMTRAANDASFAEPRIYIKDVKDLQAFQQFVDTIGVSEDPIYNKVNYDGVERVVPANGAYAQFFLQNNIAVQQTTPLAVDSYYQSAANFAGTLNGDGYTITGVDGNLFNNLSATGNVYNLGLETGSIAGEVATGGKIHTSYEYANRIVYDANGNANGNYSEEEFNNGTVAYNLNQYYLEARKKMLTAPSTTQADLAEEAAVEYVKNYYANGDYQYARMNSDGSEYLRNNANPHYYVDISTGFDTYATWHDTNHAIDAARKVDVSTPNSLWSGFAESVSAGSQMSLGASFADNAVTEVAPGTAIYKPLFNAEKIDATSEATVVKNDYIFFGQNLQATPEAHPVAIASHDVANMTNRVWRASGFYQTKVDKGFHFNASGDANKIITYVNDTKTTAIDFTGKRDEQNAASLPSTGWLEANSQKIFYAPALDLPTEYYGLRMADGVTRNLLVYTDNQTGEGDNGKIAKIAATLLNYGDDTEEIDIKGHRIEGTGSPLTYSTAKLHLVDLEDFNAPIAFNATKAWYERDPQSETGYVNDAGKAWSSICLPYTVETATLSDGIQRYQDANGNGAVGPQTNITFFYGDADDVASNPNIINHEFWLRGLNAVTTTGTKKAQFKRPTNAIAASGFAAYKPFIVSFPGSKFYEFNMEGQSITFGADDATIAVTDDNVESNKTSVSGYTYYGAFLNNEGTGVYSIDINGEGDKFEAGKAVYPFRAYLTSGSALTPNSMDADFNADGFILIGDDLSKLEDVMDGDIDRDPDGGVSTPSGLHVYGVGQRIVVVSDFATTLPVYTVTGALVRVLDVRPGTATYSGFKQGVYVVDRKKIRLR